MPHESAIGIIPLVARGCPGEVVRALQGWFLHQEGPRHLFRVDTMPPCVLRYFPALAAQPYTLVRLHDVGFLAMEVDTDRWDFMVRLEVHDTTRGHVL
jgi:hypothetical protein